MTVEVVKARLVNAKLAVHECQQAGSPFGFWHGYHVGNPVKECSGRFKKFGLCRSRFHPQRSDKFLSEQFQCQHAFGSFQDDVRG